jgi:putative transposase
MSSPQFRRKNIRLPRQHYVGQRRYFVTILCADRKPLLAERHSAELVIRTLRECAQHHNFAIYSFCAMPDHLHFLAIGMNPACNLLNFVMHFKRTCTVAYREHRAGMLWRKKFYDYILRDHDENGSVADYIRMNPVRAGLCSQASNYEFSGSFVSDWPGVEDGTQWSPPWRR